DRNLSTPGLDNKNIATAIAIEDYYVNGVSLLRGPGMEKGNIVTANFAHLSRLKEFAAHDSIVDEFYECGRLKAQCTVGRTILGEKAKEVTLDLSRCSSMEKVARVLVTSIAPAHAHAC
ncbi:hypothetical protein KEM54_003240, partial [Ascosphaera aggregata]